MPALRRLLALALVLASCSADGQATTTTDARTVDALEYALSAGRALDGTRFESVDAHTLAGVIVSLCAVTGSPASGVPAAVASLGATVGGSGDDAILTEVLLTGVAAVCPERIGADATAAHLAAVNAAVETAGGVDLAGPVTLAAGLAACDALSFGEPGDALVAVAAVGFGIEAGLAELLGGALTPGEAISAGAVLTAAATYLCPEHAPRVAEFVASLAG